MKPIIQWTRSIASAMLGAATATTALAFAMPAQAADPLPSWNYGPTKQAIVSFVEKVTKQGSADFVPAAERIATFDNDGTLWAEQPIYFQVAFTLGTLEPGQLIGTSLALTGHASLVDAVFTGNARYRSWPQSLRAFMDKRPELRVTLQSLANRDLAGKLEKVSSV